jgi:tetratricopeptide (TPR) repeat protein
MAFQSGRPGAGGRHTLIGVAITLQTAYFTVRCLTLNAESAGTLIYSITVLGAELGLGLSFALVLFELWRPRSSPAAAAPRQARTDVVLIVRDEEISLVRASLAGCERLESRHATLILNCRGRSDVRAAAEEARIACFQPPSYCSTRGEALDAVLSELTREYVAVFDAGMIPETNFLVRTTAHFSDERLAAVQTSIVGPVVLPHGSAFGRVELIPRNSDPLFQQRQVGRNRWNASTLTVSGMIVRRSALTEIGGFGPDEGETLRVSIKLHEVGWRTQYLDEPLCVDFTSSAAANILGSNTEENASDFLASIDSKPWLHADLSLPQKLCYLSTFLRSCSPIFQFVLYLAPLVALGFGLFPMATPWRIKLAVAAAVYYLAACLIRRIATGGRVRFVAHELNSMAAVWSSCLSLFGTYLARFLHRHAPGRYAVVVQANGSAAPHFVFVGLTAFALFWAWLGPTLGIADAADLIVPTLIALWNAGLSLAALERILAKSERRRQERRSGLFAVQYEVPGEQEIRGLGLAYDLSESGLGLVVYHSFGVGESIFMTLEAADGRMRLQGEVRSIRRIGSGETPSLDTPAAYRVGVLLTRATPQQRDTLLHWSALQVAGDVKGSLSDVSLRGFFGRSNRGRNIHVPILLGGNSDTEARGCVTQEMGLNGFRVFSKKSLARNSEVRFAMATPFGLAGGWARLEREQTMSDGSMPILVQEFAFTILDNGSKAIIQRIVSPRPMDAPVGEALSPFAPAPKIPLRTYAVAASIWFLLAAPLLSMSYFHAYAPELLLRRLDDTNGIPSPVERDELEAFSRLALASDSTSTDRLEALYRVLSCSEARREATRLAEALAERNPSDPTWRLYWGEGLAAAGLHIDAEDRFREALQFTKGDDRLIAAIRAAQSKNLFAAGHRVEAAVATQVDRKVGSTSPTEVIAMKPNPVASTTITRAPPNPAAITLVSAPSPKRSTFELASIKRRIDAASATMARMAIHAVESIDFNLDTWSLAFGTFEAERLRAAGRSLDAKTKYLQLLESEVAADSTSPFRDYLIAGYFRSAVELPPSQSLVDEARQVSARLLRDPGAELDAIIIATGFFERNSDVVETIALLDHAYRLNPKDAAIANRLASALETAGEYQRAGDLLKRILADVDYEGGPLQETN